MPPYNPQNNPYNPYQPQRPAAGYGQPNNAGNRGAPYGPPQSQYPGQGIGGAPNPVGYPQSSQQPAYGQSYQRPQMQQPVQQTNVPFFLDPNGPYAHIGAPPPHRKKRKGKVIVIVAAVVAFIIGGVFIASQGGSTDSEILFQTAIANSLNTRTYSKKIVSGQDNIQLKQDVTDIKKPRQSGTIDLASQGASLEGYASISNSYVRYTQFPDGASASASTLLNKWEQIRKGGALPASYSQGTGLVDAIDARTSVMGQYVVGGFSASDQQELSDLIQSNGVYTFDPSSVSQENLDGQPVTRFDVTISSSGLQALNQKVGVLMGLSQPDVDAEIKYINPDALSKATIKMYVSPTAKRLLKIAVTQGTDTVVTTYTSFDTSVVSTEPAADFQYAEFQALLTGKAGAALTGKAQDSERKKDIDALYAAIEAFRNQVGFYPSFSSINDPSWKVSNLKSIPDTTFVDPNGTSKQFAAAPTANQYSYQVYKDSSLSSCVNDTCTYFKITALLSDGSAYTKIGPKQ